MKIIGASFAIAVSAFAFSTSGAYAQPTITANGTVVTNPTPTPPTTALAIVTPSSYDQGLSVSQNADGSPPTTINLNQILINTDDLNVGANFVQGLSIVHGFGGSSAEGGRVTLDVTMSLNAALSASNTNGNFAAATFVGEAQANDNGISGAEIGSIFAFNPYCKMTSAATHYISCKAIESDTEIDSGASVLDNYGIDIVQISTDAVAGSRNDAALAFANQSGAVGWKDLILIGDGLNANPLQTNGTVLAFKGSPTVANVFDLSGATISTCALKLAADCAIDGSGNIIGVQGTFNGYLFAAFNAGATGYPTAGDAMALGWNFSNGSGEGDFINTYTAAAYDSFRWYQQTVGPGIFLMNLTSTGVLNVETQFSVGGAHGLTQTCTVDQAKTLIFTGGILTGGSCNT